MQVWIERRERSKWIDEEKMEEWWKKNKKVKKIRMNDGEVEERWMDS